MKMSILVSLPGPRATQLLGAWILCLLFDASPIPSAELRAVENSPPARPGSDWPAFMGPTADGKSAETGIRKSWKEGGPPLHWHLPVGEGYSAPSIAEGRLFLFDRHGDTKFVRSEAPTWVFPQHAVFVRETMPGDDPGTLSTQDYTDIVAYLASIDPPAPQ